MRHARRDYDGIQDRSGKILEDEPVFILRARDVNGPELVVSWAQQALEDGADPELCRRVAQWAEYMAEWRAEHGGGKVPDTPPEHLRAVEEFGSLSVELYPGGPGVVGP